MNRFGPHAQSNQINEWPHTVARMQDNSWFKFVDDVSMSKTAKAANPNVKVVARFHRDHMQQFSLDPVETRNRARAFIISWLNDSFVEFAPYIDAVEDFNEYWAASHTAEQTQARILWIDQLMWVWENVVLPDFPSFERIKWCLGNAAVGNDIPWQVARTATQADSGPHYLGYHGYVSVVSKDWTPFAIESLTRMAPKYRETFRDGNNPYSIEPFSYDGQTISTSMLEATRAAVVPGERSPDEFIWGSGRILFADEHHYKPRGYSPNYIITEGGLVRDLNGQAWLQPNDGWRHQQVTGSDMDRYVELMSEVSWLYQDWNNRNNDRLKGYVYFTSGAFDWPGFLLNGGELMDIIERTGAFPGTSPMPDPEPEPQPTHYPVNGLDISHWQGSFDGEISFENGNLFVIIKATDGFIMDMNNQHNPNLDPNFEMFTKEAVLSNHKVGAYHFFQPSRPAVAQAMSFLNAISLVEEQNIPPVLDLEGDVNLSTGVFQDMVLEWLNIVEDQTGQIPMLYTNVSFYDRWLSNPKFDRFPLWIANYRGISSRPSLPSRRDTWDIWQWTSQGNGGANGVGSAYVDQNRFNGNVLKFLGKYEDNWLAPTPPPPPPPPPPPNPCQIREQYDRVVHVINPRATAEQRQYVYDTVANNLQTVTFSYDDAGATPCINNTAVLWFLTEQEKPEYEAWFAEFYPNTSLAIVSTVDEYAATNAGSSNLLSLWQKVLLRLRR